MVRQIGVDVADIKILEFCVKAMPKSYAVELGCERDKECAVDSSCGGEGTDFWSVVLYQAHDIKQDR